MEPKRSISVPGLLSLALMTLSAAAHAAPARLSLHSGKEIYQAACVACHGPQARGLPHPTSGFDPPKTFPDFAQCDQTTPESNNTWTTIIRDGGPARGFSNIMPAFGDALTREQIAAVVAYLRSFCREAEWPRGELNLPKALVTEKAFPENEDVITTGINVGKPAAIDGELAYEKRFGTRNQLEVALPFGRTYSSTGNLVSAIGDVAIGVKRVLLSQLSADADRGSIFSVQAEVILPTGRRLEGLGTGEAALGIFGAYGLLMSDQRFLQVQTGAELPRHTGNAQNNVYLRTALGQSFGGLDKQGHVWTPMLEITGSRDLARGMKTDWDAILQFQMTLSRRQHIRADLGYLIPLTNSGDRSKVIMFYLLWDRADGGILEGW